MLFVRYVCSWKCSDCVITIFKNAYFDQVKRILNIGNIFICSTQRSFQVWFRIITPPVTLINIFYSRNIFSISLKIILLTFHDLIFNVFLPTWDKHHIKTKRRFFYIGKYYLSLEFINIEYFFFWTGKNYFFWTRSQKYIQFKI